MLPPERDPDSENKVGPDSREGGEKGQGRGAGKGRDELIPGSTGLKAPSFSALGDKEKGAAGILGALPVLALPERLGAGEPLYRFFVEKVPAR